MYYWGLKSTRENLTDKRVRQALSHLVDREEINKAIFFGQAETARSLVHPKALDFEPATLDVLTKQRSGEVQAACSTRPAGSWAPTASATRTARSSSC